MVNAISINNEYGLKSLSFTSNRRISKKESVFLEEKLQEIEDKQGVLGKTWNGIKEITTLGVSSSDCESMLEKYNNGEISFEEAVEYLDEFNSKQETMSGLFSNILTGVGAIAVAGSVAINMADRGTNDVENDVLDAKKMTKDAISGMMTGAASAVSGSQCFIYKGLEKASLLPTNELATNMIKGALCGVECGAMSGSASYVTDVAFGDKEFRMDDLITTAATSAFVSGTVGGAVGAGTMGLENSGFIQKDASVAKYSLLSSTRKALGVGEREVLDL